MARARVSRIVTSSTVPTGVPFTAVSLNESSPPGQSQRKRIQRDTEKGERGSRESKGEREREKEGENRRDRDPNNPSRSHRAELCEPSARADLLFLKRLSRFSFHDSQLFRELFAALLRAAACYSSSITTTTITITNTTTNTTTNSTNNSSIHATACIENRIDNSRAFFLRFARAAPAEGRYRFAKFSYSERSFNFFLQSSLNSGKLIESTNLGRNSFLFITSTRQQQQQQQQPSSPPPSSSSTVHHAPLQELPDGHMVDRSILVPDQPYSDFIVLYIRKRKVEVEERSSNLVAFQSRGKN
ncbi:hypothetical protein V1478_018689 [Vespula squamosa]|uniref:Uncharacterized protein n=1 Tax=Vespula squamosa TaxID=30214 RepID=A0ABD1ZTI4_VESSQ